MRDPSAHDLLDPKPGLPATVGRLKRRADFLRAAKGRRWHVAALTVQAAPNEAAGTRLGYTLTRKVGSAVVRNRVRRRLKEAVRSTPDLPVLGDHDYVIVGRIEALRLPFPALRQALVDAVRHVSQRHVSARRPEIRPKRTRPAT